MVKAVEAAMAAAAFHCSASSPSENAADERRCRGVPASVRGAEAAPPPPTPEASAPATGLALAAADAVRAKERQSKALACSS